MNFVQQIVAKLRSEPALVFGALASLFTALAEAATAGPITIATAVPILGAWAVRTVVTPEQKAKARERLAFVDGIIAADSDSDALVLDVEAIDPDDSASFLRLLDETQDQDDEGSTGVQV